MTMVTSFERLREMSQPAWSAAVNHRFVSEWLTGTISQAAISRYLIQDYRFLDNFLALIGAAIACVDDGEARLRFGRFAGMIASEENTYFIRAFAALNISPAQREREGENPVTQRFNAIMAEATATRAYGPILAVLNVAEGIYLDWASRATHPLPENFIHAEWITLHNNPVFSDFVAFLRAELTRIQGDSDAQCQDFFLRTVGLEQAFFDAVYA